MGKDDKRSTESVVKELTQPKSVCSCGHTGDGPNSQHEIHFQQGHGKCMLCDCPKFTWAGFIQ